jgi:predicted permease
MDTQLVRRLPPLAWRRSVESIILDVRYGVRSYRRTPAFAAVAILTCALAIGANTTIFTLLNALVLRNLPVRDPQTLIIVDAKTASGSTTAFSYAMFQELARTERVFTAVIGWWGVSVMGVEIDGALTNGAVWGATGNLYTELGVAPVVGRLLTPADMAMAPPEAQPVVVLGHGYWLRHFNGDPRAIGRTIRIEGVPFQIVGVSPPRFTGFGLVAQPDLQIPLPAVALVNGRPIASVATRPSQWIHVVGRLKPGVTQAQARAALTSAWPALLDATVPSTMTAAERREFLGQTLVVMPGATGAEPQLRARFTRPLVIVFGIAGLVLLIASANLASLMLSRTAFRSHELRIRLALGASRWRVSRQLVVESLLLALAGGLAGLLVASWTSAAIRGLIFADMTIPSVFDTAPDARVLAFTATAAVALGMLFSLAPMWLVGRQGPGVQAHTRTTARTGRAGERLVGVQVAMSVVLLVCAGLLVRSLQAVRHVDSGMHGTAVRVAYPKPRPQAYAFIDNDAYYPQLVDRISQVPGIEAASVSLLKPAAGGGGGNTPVARKDTPEDAIVSERTPVAPAFFHVLGIRLRQGRDFSWADSSRSRPVAILSDSLARRLFGAADAVGAHVRIGLDPARQDVEVIGVVADAHLYDLKHPNVNAVYIPALQDADASYKCLVVRGSGFAYADLKRSVESLGQEILGRMDTLDHITDQALLEERLIAMLAGCFGALALLLAGIGLHGVMAYAVAARMREIGIRMALGAEPRRVVTTVVGDGVGITIVGAIVGLAAALALSRLMASLLFGVTTHDAVTFLAAPALLVVVAMVACVVPAARAARIDPVTVLRLE